jgi:hypothetical protein
LEEEVVDQEEEETLGASPDDKEMEEVLAEATQDDGYPPNGMPGQLPTKKGAAFGKRLHGN